MITLYTSSSCSSCRKAKKWLDNNKIPYKENGFEDIISTRSKVFKDSQIEPDSMKFSELANFIIDNPTILKRPIIINDQIMQTGYNKDEIRAFIPAELRNFSVCTEECGDCEYKECVEQAMA